jgi:D-aspartate ligase
MAKQPGNIDIETSRIRNVDKCPTIVLGADITALGVLRALRRSGLPAAFSADKADIASWSRSIIPLHDYPGEALAPDALTRWLESTDFHSAVLMPCSDRWVQSVSRLDEATCRRFRRWTPDPSIVDTVVDKNKFRATLESLNLPHPRTYDLQRDVSAWQIPEEVFAAAFLKPHDSAAHLAQCGTKGVMVKNFEEASQQAQTRWEKGIELMLQEYVPGPPLNHYFIDGFRTRDGSTTHYLARQRLRMFPPDFGNSSDMVTVPLATVTPAVETLSAFFNHTGFHGIFSAEFKLDSRDGLFKLLEINGRPWWFVDFADRCGLHVCAAAHSDALGLEVPPQKPYKVGKRCTHPYYDWDAYRHQDNRSAGAFLRTLMTWMTSNQPIFSWSDPMPSLVGFSGLVRRAIARRLRWMGKRTAN